VDDTFISSNKCFVVRHPAAVTIPPLRWLHTWLTLDDAPVV
jgi:hypothetical protein